MADLCGHFDAVEQHVGGAEQLGQLFLFNAVKGRLQDFSVTK